MSEQSRALVPVGSGELTVYGGYVPPTDRQMALSPKKIDQEALAAVMANTPWKDMAAPASQSGSGVDAIMSDIFPAYYRAIAESADNPSDGDSFKRSADRLMDMYSGQSMTGPIDQIRNLLAMKKTLETVERSDPDFFDGSRVLPVEYLPELFMAVPVWYFWSNPNTIADSRQMRKNKDPQVSGALRYMANLVPSNNWSDMFLAFNRRMRIMQDYNGDAIPPSLFTQTNTLARHLDYVVVMTPYHDVAGSDWADINWMRSIDPYIVGFSVNIPDRMFLIGRFSDSGLFPLHTEMVADTIAFLRANKRGLLGFDEVRCPFWMQDGRESHKIAKMGTHLINQTIRLLEAFDRGRLFDWLKEPYTR